MTEINHIPQIALFIDLDNIDAAQGGFRYLTKLEPLLKWLKQRGKIVIRRAYGSWGVYQRYLKQLKALSIESIHLRGGGVAGKNLADVRMAIDLTEMIFTHANIEIFALVTGDSDFTPVLHRLAERGKYVIGIGFRSISGHHLIEQCDEFIFYDTLLGDGELPETQAEVTERGAQLLRQVIQKLARKGTPRVPANRVKAMIKEIAPDFKEREYGFKKFKDFLRSYPQVVSLEQTGNQLLVCAAAPGQEQPRPRPRPVSYEEARQALAQAMENLTAHEELPVNPSRVHAELLKLIPTFNSKHYRFSKFRQFLEANAKILQVVTREDGSVVVAVPAAPAPPREIPDYAVVQEALAKLMEELDHQDALPINIGQIKQRLMNRLPNFNERNYRFDKFLSLLQDNPAIVRLERENDASWLAHRVAPPEPLATQYRRTLAQQQPPLIAPDLRWRIMVHLYSLLKTKPQEFSLQTATRRLARYYQQRQQTVDPAVIAQVVELAIRGGAVQTLNGGEGREPCLALMPNLRREELVVRGDGVYLTRFLEMSPEFDSAALAEALFEDTLNREQRLEFMLEWLKRSV